MEFEFRGEMLGELHNSAEVEAQCLIPAAYREAARVAAATPVDSGDTRASTTVEGGHRSADGRSRAAWVVQGGPGTATVQQQFGNAHERTPARQFDRGGT